MFKQMIGIALLVCANVASAAIDPIVDAEDRRNVEAPAIKAAAASKSSTLRTRAALAYGRIQSSAGLNPLLQLLKDKSPDVREAAAFALGQLAWQADFAGGREAEIQTELSAALADNKQKVRLAALAAIGKIGLLQTPDLVASALSSSDAKMRAVAVQALFRYRLVLRLREMEKDLGDLPAPTFDRLTVLAEDSDPTVRRNVAYFFARVVDARGEKLLGKLAESKDKWTRVYALQGLARMKAKNSTDVLSAALKDREYSVRLAAAGAKIAAGENFAVELALRKDPYFLVRAAYAQGLDPKEATSATELSHILRWDSSPTVRAEALKSLATTKGDELQGWLMTHAQDSQWVMREATVAASAKLTPAAREKFLRVLASDREPNVRGAALEALFTIPSSTAFAVLKRALESPVLIERSVAESALKERKESEVIDLLWKTYGASGERRWTEVRQDIVDTLSKTDNSTTTGYLKQILEKDSERSVQVKAHRALEARGVKDLPPVRDGELSLSPYRELTFKKNPRVTFSTDRGDFTVECFAKQAPIHVASLVGLVKKQAYDGLMWHRVVANFVVQGGDPDGTGAGDSGYSVRAEINDIAYDRGTLGMPRAQGFDTGGSQVFFAHLPTPHLDGQYTVFGRVIKGVEVLDRLERGDKINSTKWR